MDSQPTDSTTEPVNTPKKTISLVTIPITDDNAALNVLVGFVGIAQKRGAFDMQESSKIWECVKRFTQDMPEAK
tara:strand:+ start:11097 stop:11318 length:222 start_codon:yes stop_codon:yes gene_type:complete